MIKRLVLWIYIFFLLLLGLYVINYLPQSDENYITYRFARNLIEGHGLTYWTPDPPVTTYPVAPILITDIAAVLKMDLPDAGIMLATIASIIGAVCLAQIIDGGLFAGLAYIALTCLSPSPVLFLMLAFSLGGLVAAMKQRWRLAGLLLGLAILSDPFALVLALLILIMAVREYAWKRYLAIVLPVTVIGLLSVMISTGSLRILAITPSLSEWGIFGWGFLALLVGVGLLTFSTRYAPALREKPYVVALLILAMAALLIAIIRQSTPTFVVIPGALAILSFIRRGRNIMFLIFSSLVIISGSGNIFDFFTTGSGRDNLPSEVIATDHLGSYTFESESKIIDLSGQIMPQPPLEQAFFLKYIPDVVYTDRVITWPSFKTTYEVDSDNSDFYRRVVNFSPLDDQPIDIIFGRGDMHLTGMAMGRILHPGDLGRVRLDWNLKFMPLAPVQIGLTLVDTSNKNIGAIIDTLPPENWMIGDTQTYHVLSLPSNLPAGKLELHLSVKYRDGTFIEGAKIGEAEVVH